MHRPSGALWHHRDFMKMWTGQTISQFGSSISQLALPIIAVQLLHASPFAVAALGTVEFLPFLLFTLPAGVWVDRLPRRAVLIVGDVGPRAPAPVRADRLPGRPPDPGPALRGRLHDGRPDRLLRRRVPVVPPGARRAGVPHRGQLEARGDPFGGTARRAAGGGRVDPAPDRALRSGLGLGELLHLGRVPARDPQEGAAAREAGGRPPRRHAARALGGSALRRQAPIPAAAGDLDGRLQLLLERRVLDPDRLRDPDAAHVRGPDRRRLRRSAASAGWRAPRSRRGSSACSASAARRSSVRR